MSSIDITKLDRFLRNELSIDSSIAISVVSSATKGRENALRGPNVTGTLFMGEKDQLRDFLIVYKHGISAEKLLITLCHEYTHISQISTRRLRIYSEYHIWMNQRFEITPKDIGLKEHKYTVPWEKEAYQLETSLSSKFNEKEKSSFPSIIKHFLLG